MVIPTTSSRATRAIHNLPLRDLVPVVLRVFTTELVYCSLGVVDWLALLVVRLPGGLGLGLLDSRLARLCMAWLRKLREGNHCKKEGSGMKWSRKAVSLSITQSRHGNDSGTVLLHAGSYIMRAAPETTNRPYYIYIYIYTQVYIYTHRFMHVCADGDGHDWREYGWRLSNMRPASPWR